MPVFPIDSPISRPISWVYGAPQPYLVALDYGTSSVFKWDDPSFSVVGSTGLGYKFFMNDGNIIRWGQSGADGAFMSGTGVSYTQNSLGSGVGSKFGADYYAHAHLTDDWYGFIWVESTTRVFSVRIFARSDGSSVQNFDVTFPSVSGKNIVAITGFFNGTNVALSARYNGIGQAYDKVITRLYGIDGTFISEVQNEDSHKDDPWGPPIGGTSNGREDSLWMTSDRLYAGNNVFDMTGASKGQIPQVDYVYNQNSLFNPFVRSITSNGTKLIMCEGYYRYVSWGSGAWGLGDGIVSYYEYDITKGGGNDTYTQTVNTTRSGAQDRFFGVTVDLKGLY